MKLVVLFSVSIFSLLIFSTHSQAKLSCQQVFKDLKIKKIEDQITDRALNDHKEAVIDLFESTQTKEANGNIHNLVIETNRLFDHIVEIFLMKHAQPQSESLLKTRSRNASQMIEALQVTFNLDNKAILEAIKNRVQLELAAYQEKAKAKKRKRAIGFHNNQSSESFHSEKGEKQPIGFIPPRNTSPNPSVKAPIGFIPPKLFTAKLQEYVELTPEMGFIPKNQFTTEYNHGPQPIGFIHFKTESKMIEADKLWQILLNIESGLFELNKY